MEEDFWGGRRASNLAEWSGQTEATVFNLKTWLDFTDSKVAGSHARTEDLSLAILVSHHHFVEWWGTTERHKGSILLPQCHFQQNHRPNINLLWWCVESRTPIKLYCKIIWGILEHQIDKMASLPGLWWKLEHSIRTMPVCLSLKLSHSAFCSLLHSTP